MSLVVWLPLNGDLENQGLSDAKAINHNATINNNGKIGKCYQNTASNYITIPVTINVKQSFSLCYWYRIDTWNSWGTTITLNAANGDYLGMCPHSNGTMIGTNWYETRNGTNTPIFDSYHNNTIVAGQWNHIVITFNGTNNIKTYINGILVSNGTVRTNPLTNFTELTLFRRGRQSVYGYSSLNDVRVYDHALSAKEVKELAKGLVLHYRLAGPGQENIIEHSHNGNGWSIGSGWTSFTDGDGTKGYRFTRTGATANNWVRIIPPTKINPNDYPEGITVSIDIKTPNISAINNTCIGALQIYDSTGARSGWYEPNWDLSKVKNNIWTKISYFFTQEALRTVQQSGMTYNYTMFSFQLVQNGDISIKNFKAERGNVRTPWCPNPADALYTALGYSTGIEYDCSGYKHNGIPVSTTVRPTWDVDSPRYTTSFNYSGDANQANYTTSKDMNFIDNFSWAIWIKPNYTSGRAQYVFTGGRADAGGFGYGLQVASTTSCTIFYGDNGRYSINAKSGEWHHVAFTKSGTTCKCYLDGRLVSTNTFGGTNPTYSDGNGVGIGCFHYYGDIYPYIGKASDLRIYATALSDADIAELYHSAVIVDNTGKNYAYEYFEG